MSPFKISAALIIVLLNIAIAFGNIRLLYLKKTKPSLAMWFFFSLATTGSLLTYLSNGNYGILDNVLNSSDLLLCYLTTIAVWVWGDKSGRFNRFDLMCLIAVVACLLLWGLSGNPFMANLAIQLIMVIAYFPVIKRLWNASENTESFWVWTGLALAPVISLLSCEGTLAKVYSLRAMLCSLLLMGLMIRVKCSRRRFNQDSN